MLIAIWAQDKNGLIGRNQTLPWKLPNDLKFFKEKTSGSIIVMGRKTFDGMGGRLLPNRETVVMTRDKTFEHANVTVLHSTEELLCYAQSQDKTIFIIGGSGVFEETLPYCDQLYRTMIDAEFEGDTYMTEIDWAQWRLNESIEGIVDDKNLYGHRFELFERIQSKKK